MTNSPQNTVELIDKYGEKVTGVLQQLAEKIGVGIDHFYPVFVKQQQLEGISFFALILLFVFIAVLSLKFRRDSDFLKNDEPSLRLFTTIFGLAVCIGILITLTSSGITCFSQIFNPEYNAIKEITNLIK